MPSSLKDNYNSEYVGFANRLKGSAGIVEVWVEDEYDIPFWHDVLEANSDIRFRITPYHNSELNTGKGNILKNVQRLGPNLIACVDSDYDYLLDRNSTFGRLLKTNPYIVQTFTYSIENYNCHPATLGGLCVNATLEQTDFDFSLFFRRFSEAIYPLLMWSLMMRDEKMESVLPFSYFREVVDFDMPVSEKNVEEVLSRVTQKVNRAVKGLAAEYPAMAEKMPELKSRMEKKGVRQDNSFLFINGHILSDLVEKDLLIPLCRNMVSRHIRDIYKSRATMDEKRRKKLHYDNITRRSVAVLVASNFAYRHHSELYEKLLKPRIEKLSAMLHGSAGSR